MHVVKGPPLGRPSLPPGSDTLTNSGHHSNSGSPNQWQRPAGDNEKTTNQ